MCQCPKEKKQMVYNTNILKFSYYSEVVMQLLKPTGKCEGRVWVFISWYSFSWKDQACKQEWYFSQDGRKQMIQEICQSWALRHFCHLWRVAHFRHWWIKNYNGKIGGIMNKQRSWSNMAFKIEDSLLFVLRKEADFPSVISTAWRNEYKARQML